MIISKTNVRYITGTAKKVEGKTVAIKFRIFAENEAILKDVTDRLKIKATGIVGKLVSGAKYNGWDLKLNRFYREFITKNRAEFQDAFKAAKKSAITASNLALVLAESAKETAAKAKEKKGKK